MAINRNKTALKDVTFDVPHCGNLTLQKLNDAKYVGPKLTQFNKRLEMVRFTAANEINNGKIKFEFLQL